MVLTLIDQCTKWAECITLQDKSAESVATTFLRAWVYRFGVPMKLISDRDPSFCNAIITNLTARIGITRLTSAAYHPEGNAVIESFYRTLAIGLRHINPTHISFDEALDLVLFGYRSTLHTTTGHSPSYLTYGVDPRLAPDCDWRMERALPNQERLKFLNLLRLDVQFQAQEAINRQNIKRNQARQPTEFEAGQLVLCRLIPLEQLRYKSSYYKAVPRWTLPH